MNYLSVCSGIEAATVAWHPMGWKPVGFSEIENFPSHVLKHHYPEVPNLGDMTKFKEWKIGSDVNLLVGGTPCQSFSVAGLRKGLDDPRGNLMLTYLAIADKYRPRWLVWENVPGVLSSNGGKDFGTFLGGLAELGYGFAYRVLDAQYFGVAQRRRRVFVVGYLGDWRPAAAVLFERDSLCGNPAPSREARKKTAGSISQCTDASGLQQTVGTLCADTHPGAYSGQDAYTGRLVPHSVAGALTAKGPLAMGAPEVDAGHYLPVPHSVAIQGNLIGRDTGGPNGVGATEDDVMYTLTKADVHGVTQPICFEPRSPDGHARVSGDISPTLNTMGGGQREPCVAQPIVLMDQGGSVMNVEHDMVGTLRRETHGHEPVVMQPIPIDTMNHIGRGDSHSFGEFQPGAPSYTLTKGHSHAVAQPMIVHGTQDPCTSDIAFAQGRNNGGENVLVQSVPFQNTADCLTAAYGTKWNGNASATNGSLFASQAMAVRRLTPVECERLQGFPDDYTRIPWKMGYWPADKHSPEVRDAIASQCPDGPRYKALGNSMAVPVMAWIGKRIEEYERQAERS